MRTESLTEQRSLFYFGFIIFCLIVFFYHVCFLYSPLRFGLLHHSTTLTGSVTELGRFIPPSPASRHLTFYFEGSFPVVCINVRHSKALSYMLTLKWQHTVFQSCIYFVLIWSPGCVLLAVASCLLLMLALYASSQCLENRVLSYYKNSLVLRNTWSICIQ